MYEMLNDFPNKTNELHGDYLREQDEQIVDVIENFSLV